MFSNMFLFYFPDILKHQQSAALTTSSKNPLQTAPKKRLTEAALPLLTPTSSGGQFLGLGASISI